MEIQEGMTVYGAGDKPIGRIERLHGDGFHVAGQHYDRDSVLRVEHNRLYLRGAGAAGRDTMVGQDEGEIRVPVAEERLAVGKREAELGEVDVRKTVTEEQQSAPVTLQREEVHVHERDIPDRPLRAGDDAFTEGTIRVPVRGEEAVVAKEAVVTGEVVIDKERTTEQRQVGGTVRKQHVDVDENYSQARADFEQDFETRRASATDEWWQGRTFEQAEPNYRTGFSAAHDERYAGRSFEEAEPDLRSQYDASSTLQTGSPFAAGDRTSGTSGGTRANEGDAWERLREEIRSGWNRARNR
jgi:uncharacterized protein (TIGR02271 family)